MSRGFRASESVAVKDEPQTISNYLIGDKTLGAAVDGIVASKDTAAAFKEFSDFLYGYRSELSVDIPKSMQSQKPGPDEDRKWSEFKKELKGRMIELYKQLPPEVRRAVEVDPSEASKLFRGVKDFDIEEKGKWENGKFVYSFTRLKDVALRFTANRVLSEDEKASKRYTSHIITADKMKSFGGIIDPVRVAVLAAELNRRLEGDLVNKRITPAEFSQMEVPENRMIHSDEAEYIIYDIAFKGKSIDGLAKKYFVID